MLRAALALAALRWEEDSRRHDLAMDMIAAATSAMAAGALRRTRKKPWRSPHFTVETLSRQVRRQYERQGIVIPPSPSSRTRE